MGMIEKSRYDFLLPFRAIAALWVMLFHIQVFGGWQWLDLPSAKHAVDLFMVISGFLMASQARTFDFRDPSEVRTFWGRRFFRIAPSYYLALLLAASLQVSFIGGLSELANANPEIWSRSNLHPTDVDYSLRSLALHLTFLFGLFPSYASTTGLPDWSLSLEMQFYLVLPFIALAMNRYGSILASVVIALLAMASLSYLPEFPENSFLPLRIDPFLSGMLLFVALIERRIVALPFAVWLAAEATPGPWHAGPVMVLLMYVMGWLELGRRIKPETFRLWQWPSELSYGVYLFHAFAISAAGLLIPSAYAPETKTAIMLLSVVPATYLLALASHRLVELPGIRLGKRIAEGRAMAQRSA